MSRRPRTLCVTEKVKTQFGSMYVQVDHDETGLPLGGRISSPGKEPDSQVQRLVDQLSDTLDAALRSVRAEQNGIQVPRETKGERPSFAKASEGGS